MRIAVFAEGSYPYVAGGVSGWMQMLIKGLPENEFILYTMIPDRKDRGKFRYEIPSNVMMLRESVLLEDEIWEKNHEKVRIPAPVKQSLRSLLFGQDVEWGNLFRFFDTTPYSAGAILMGTDFLELSQELYIKKYPHCVFTDFLWSLRSLYEPLFSVLRIPVEDADCFHAICTGYAGILASKARYLYNKPLLLTEHGIYTREREEEIIKAQWTHGLYKNLWIQYFYTLSECAYQFADQVISLFQKSREIQVEIGCPREKTRIISNGVFAERLENLPGKEEEDKDVVYIGAILRIVPIKDVKTLLYAYAMAKEKVPGLHLYLMGAVEEDEEYYRECLELVENFQIQDVVFTGNIDVRQYIGKMDIIILTSISEGQPLCLLEAMAAGKACIATDVGSCRELLYGAKYDHFGQSGLVVPAMNVDKISEAIVALAEDQEARRQMGESGKARVKEFYRNEEVIRKYLELYGYWCREGEKWQESVLN